jgi:hypothetical protein
MVRSSARKTEPVNTVVSGNVMSCCLTTGSQRVLLRRHRGYNDGALETSGNERGAMRLGTARSSTSRGSERYGVNTASPVVAVVRLGSVFAEFCVCMIGAWGKHVTICIAQFM